MAAKITRTITTTVVDIAYVDVDETGNLAMREDTLTLDGEFSDYAKLENFCVEIDRRYQTIETQKEKIRQMEEEEKQILGNAPKVENSDGVVFCGQCGTQNGNTYKFCVKCGSPLA